MRVLIVEDELKMASLVRRGLAEEGHAADVAVSGEEALWMAEAHPYDAIVLDVMLPGRDGFEVCRTLRERGVWAPVLMLTAHTTVPDRVAGLDAGADDYLPKPFAFAELLARLRALTRRDRRPITPERLEVGPLAIDVRGRRVYRDGAEIALTTREYALLEYLARRAGDVVGRADIAEHVWDEHYDAFSNVVDVYVQRLRRKLDDPKAPSIIRTRRGQGYQLL